MTYEEIQEEWKKDGKVDALDLTFEAANIPVLHAKYFDIYYQENKKLIQMKSLKTEEVRLKTQYYRGDMDSAEIKQLGYEPLNKMILKADVPSYVETDKKIIKITLKIEEQQMVVKFLEEILRGISNRNFIIKNMIDWERFKVGS